VCEKPGYSVASMQILVKAKRTKPSLIEWRHRFRTNQ
jgi:hypothetical protein